MVRVAWFEWHGSAAILTTDTDSGILASQMATITSTDIIIT
jgi:hypothetical protein